MKNKLLTLIQLTIISIVFYFCILPIISVIIYGFAGESGYLNQKSLSHIFRLLCNSLSLSIAVTVISVLLGLTVTFTLRRFKFKGRNLLKTFIMLPMVSPAFVGSISFIMLFGRRGLITHDILNMNVSPYGWHGVLILQIISFTTFSYIVISGSIQNLDTTIEHAARNLGASEIEVFFGITLPMMVPEIAATALLVFLSSMADFMTPLMIGGNFSTLASDIYIQIIGIYDMRSGALSGTLLLIPCTAAFIVQRYFSKKRIYITDKSRGSNNIEYEKVSNLLKGILIFVTICIISVSVINYFFIIIGAITKNWRYDYTFTLEHVRKALSRDLRPYINSVKLSFIVAFTSSLLGVLLGYLINRKKIILAHFIDFMGVFPAAIPGILFGIGYLVTFKYPVLGIGRFILKNSTPLILLGTGVIIYIICIARSINISMKSTYALLEHLDPELENASYNLGAGRIQTFFYIMVPLLKNSFSASYIKTFSNTMTTLGAIIFLLLPKNKVAVQTIFQSITSSTIGESSTLALMLSLLNLLLLGIFYLIVYHKELIDRFWRNYTNEN